MHRLNGDMSWHIPGGTEKNHRNKSGYCVLAKNQTVHQKYTVKCSCFVQNRTVAV